MVIQGSRVRQVNQGPRVHEVTMGHQDHPGLQDLQEPLEMRAKSGRQAHRVLRVQQGRQVPQESKGLLVIQVKLVHRVSLDQLELEVLWVLQDPLVYLVRQVRTALQDLTGPRELLVLKEPMVFKDHKVLKDQMDLQDQPDQ